MECAAISHKIKNVWEGELKLEIWRRGEITDTYSNDTQEWQESQIEDGEFKEEPKKSSTKRV